MQIPFNDPLLFKMQGIICLKRGIEDVEVEMQIHPKKFLCRAKNNPSKKSVLTINLYSPETIGDAIMSIKDEQNSYFNTVVMIKNGFSLVLDNTNNQIKQVEMDYSPIIE